MPSFALGNDPKVHRTIRRTAIPLTVVASLVAASGCAAEPEEPVAEGSAEALSAVDVACGANRAQIGLAGAGAAAAVAGYVTAAAIAIEAIVASGAPAQVLRLSQAFLGALTEVAGATAEVQALRVAVTARDAVRAGPLLATAVTKLASSGSVRDILKLGYRVAEAMTEGLIQLDAANPIGVRRNLDLLNDGLRFACGNCGEQWACAPGETASRMVDYDPTRPLANDTPAIATGRSCARGTSFWSTRSYLRQCYDCCDEAGYTDDGASGFHACRAVCNAAYK